MRLGKILCQIVPIYTDVVKLGQDLGFHSLNAADVMQCIQTDSHRLDGENLISIEEEREILYVIIIYSHI